jgi:DNA polymerase III subunit epsilon
MKFAALDLETANSKKSSICQIGIAFFENGILKRKWMSLVNPEENFFSINVGIHGITGDLVKDAPTFADIWDDLREILENNLIVSHTTFDHKAIEAACEKYNLEMPPVKWLDCTKVVRRTWPQFARGGFGLANMSEFLEIPFKHHDAYEDARMCGEILNAAIIESDFTASEWYLKAQQPPIAKKKRPPKKSIPMEVNRDGHLFGNILVFTGKLTIRRADAIRMASEAGCLVANRVIVGTTMLVIGSQAQHHKTKKQLQAEAMIAEGFPVSILSEPDFRRILKK